MVYNVFRICARLTIILLIPIYLLSGCVWVAAGVAVGGVAGAAFMGGSVSETYYIETALAVERAVYAIEQEGGTVTDLSFADGYAVGNIKDYNVSVNIYPRDDGSIDVSVRASKFFIPNALLAEKILENYRTFKK